MASLDKTSVREEVGRLKADFDRLSAEGKISAEIRALMNSLFMIIELILAVFLERSTKKDSQNSSKPSSQTKKDESALSHPGSNDKGQSENKGLAKNTGSGSGSGSGSGPESRILFLDSGPDPDVRDPDVRA